MNIETNKNYMDEYRWYEDPTVCFFCACVIEDFTSVHAIISREDKWRDYMTKNLICSACCQKNKENLKAYCIDVDGDDGKLWLSMYQEYLNCLNKQ